MNLKALKKHAPNSYIFLCGPFSVLNSPSIIEENKWIDGIIVDQVEATAEHIVDSIKKKKKFNELLGGIYVYKNKIVKHSPLNNYVSLNNLPLPSRDLEKNESGAFINIESSRGCRYMCPFCHIPLSKNISKNGPSIDYRSSIKVVDEIESLNKKLGKNLFIFNDSIFWGSSDDNERVIRICNEILKRKIKIKFYVYLRCRPFVDEKVLKKMVKAGLVRVFLGVENVSENSQKTLGRKSDEDLFISLRKKLETYGVDVHIGFIVFEPFASLEDIKININFLNKINKIYRIGTILEPVRVVPGSNLFCKLKKEKLLKNNLTYKNITYGYRFKDKKVGNLFSYIKEQFGEKIGREMVEFEYYCSTENLLNHLIKRDKPMIEKILLNKRKEFLSHKDKINKSIYKYLLFLIKVFERGEKIDTKKQIIFSNDFRKNISELRILYYQIINLTSQKNGNNVIDMLYSGLERIR